MFFQLPFTLMVSNDYTLPEIVWGWVNCFKDQEGQNRQYHLVYQEDGIIKRGFFPQNKTRDFSVRYKLTMDEIRTGSAIWCGCDPDVLDTEDPMEKSEWVGRGWAVYRAELERGGRSVDPCGYREHEKIQMMQKWVKSNQRRRDELHAREMMLLDEDKKFASNYENSIRRIKNELQQIYICS